MSDHYGHQHDYRPPQPPLGAQSAMSPQDERTWGALAHGLTVGLMIFSGGVMGFIGGLLVYVLYKDRGPFVRAHAANSLNVQITMFIWLVGLVLVGIVVGILTLGLGLLVVVPLFVAAPFVAGTLHVIGAIKAYNGEWWTPPLTMRFVD